MIPLTLSIAIAAFISPLQHQEEWVVKGLLPARPRVADELAWLHPPSAQGDLDGDGRTDIAQSGDSTPPPFSGRPVWDSCRLYSGHLEDPFWEVATVRTAQFMDYARIRLPLRTPQGWAILLDSSLQQSIESYDPKTGRQLGTVQLPPSPGPGIPPADGFDFIYPAGDVNLDGWDDAFWVRWTNYWTYAGVIDGATLTVAWQHVETWNHSTPATPSMGEPAPLPDIDGDSISDFLFIQSIYIGSGYGFVAVALSGRTGTTIWRRHGSGQMAFGNTWGKDLNDDGISDLVLAVNHDSMQAVDGATGQTIWTLNMDALDPYFFSGYQYRHFSGSLISRSVIDGRLEVQAILRYYSPLHTEWGLAQVDGATGAIRNVIDLPSSAKPFGDEVFSPSFYFPIGDVDRDGTMEFAAEYRSWSHAPPWFSGPSISYAILGQKTLFLPDQARVGVRLRAHVSIPSAGNMDCMLLLSASFLPVGGWTLDGVQTNLAPSDLVFQATLGRPELRTRLGPGGKGSLSFVLPQNPSLVGKRLHARALIRDPASGETWTVSSPASLLILP